ncbi:MAG: Ig-like domain-containing protein [Flavobacteriales bacterium]|nr:Ig-like domain-containing protein [Flavobacteriales bacterium]
MKELKYIIGIVLLVTLNSCANRGRPSGGDFDTTPPSIIKSEPENFTNNFNSSEVNILFDEYIKIRNLQKELIISPPIDPIPEIIPVGAASKEFAIKGLDSLSPNTTYSFNFGESIEDNNEGNPFSNFKYVFSTGKYIDSLIIKGYVKDALEREVEDGINVLLYEVDSSYNDSIVYMKKPKYITKVVDSTSTFSLENLKTGNYLLIALKEEESERDYIFQTKSDKIGFAETFIQIPKDSTAKIQIFKEDLPFKISKPKQKTKNSFAFGFEGKIGKFKIDLIQPIDLELQNRIIKDRDSDTLYYWLKPSLDIDSIKFLVSTKTKIDTFKINLRKNKIDSLQIKSLQSNVLKFDENLELHANIPYNKIDVKRIQVLDKDSIQVPFTYELDTINNIYKFNISKDQDQSYSFEFLPSAIEDYYGNTNDTLFYKLKTKTYDDYGNLRLTLKNAITPIIIQLVNRAGEVKYEQYVEDLNPIEFRHIDAGKYYIRIVFDSNQNKKYDSGSFLKRRFPEKVSYFPEELDVRAGWDLIQEFILN